MRYLTLFAILFPIRLWAQQPALRFEKRFVESEDRWVAFRPDKDGSYAYGFIYIDEQAGLTLNYEGIFKISPSGEYIPKKLDSTNMKVRLEPNNVLVAFIPDTKFSELKISAVPEWLKYYKKDSNSVARLYRWGFLYNGWDECGKALTYLQRARNIDPDYQGLSVELAYSYNCLKQYDSAIAVLQYALKANATDAYTNKELVYAQLKSGRLDEASKSCKNAITVCKDKTYNGENCYNLLHSYYEKKDKENFNHWLGETKKWNSKNEKLIKSIAFMESEINK
jgi:hypothetical protein